MGHALCQRLLQEDDGLHLCLACRNPDRAEAARAALLASCPSAQITAVQVDVSDPRSVLRAAGELRRRWASAAGFRRDRVTAAAGLGRDGTGQAATAAVAVEGIWSEGVFIRIPGDSWRLTHERTLTWLNRDAARQ